MKAYYIEEGKKFTECEFNFKMDVASFLQYYNKKFSLAGLEKITGINQGQLSDYVTGKRIPSKSTVQKIEHNLHEFANELNQVEFI